MSFPINLYYPEFPVYAEVIVHLQIGIAIVKFCTNFGYTVNIKTRQGIETMFYVSLLTWVIVLITRATYYFYTSYKILNFFYTEEGPFLTGACIGVGSMALVNLAMMVDC